MSSAATSGVSSQLSWRWCHKCQVLFHPGLGAGVCPAGGGHDVTGCVPYFAAISPYATGGQEGWRYCGKCHALHISGTTPGVCPAGGVHTAEGSLPYSLQFGNLPGCKASNVQQGWRRCRKCHESCYAGLPGVCASGGAHDFRGSQ